MGHDVSDRFFMAIFLCLGFGIVTLLTLAIIASKGFLLIPIGIALLIFGLAYWVAGPIMDRMFK